MKILFIFSILTSFLPSISFGNDLAAAKELQNILNEMGPFYYMRNSQNLRVLETKAKFIGKCQMALYQKYDKGGRFASVSYLFNFGDLEEKYLMEEISGFRGLRELDGYCLQRILDIKGSHQYNLNFKIKKGKGPIKFKFINDRGYANPFTTKFDASDMNFCIKSDYNVGPWGQMDGYKRIVDLYNQLIRACSRESMANNNRTNVNDLRKWKGNYGLNKYQNGMKTLQTIIHKGGLFNRIYNTFHYKDIEDRFSYQCTLGRKCSLITYSFYPKNNCKAIFELKIYPKKRGKIFQSFENTIDFSKDVKEIKKGQIGWDGSDSREKIGFAIILKDKISFLDVKSTGNYRGSGETYIKAIPFKYSEVEGRAIDTNKLMLVKTSLDDVLKYCRLR